MAKSQSRRPAVAGTGSSTMIEAAADPDSVSKEVVPESSEKPPDTQAKHHRRSVLRVSQLLLRAIAAHKGLTLTVLKKEFGEAGYQVRRKCSPHSLDVPRAKSARGTLLRVSGSKAQGYFRVWKNLQPIGQHPAKASANLEEVPKKRFGPRFSRRYRKPPEEPSPPSLGDLLKPETPEMPEAPRTPEMSETTETSDQKIFVEQLDETPRDTEEISLTLTPGYSLCQKASKKRREDMRNKVKQQKMKKMKMKEKSKSRLSSTARSSKILKRPKAKKEKRMSIKENKRGKVKGDKKIKSKKMREKSVVDLEKQLKPNQSHNSQSYCQKLSQNQNPPSAKASRQGGHMKAFDPQRIPPEKKAHKG